MSVEEQYATVQAVVDALFGMGRISPLLRQADVENIEAIGHDTVLLEDSTGELRHGPKIAASDAELIADLQFLASRHGRPFSEAVPWLDLELAEDGSRLAATAWVTPRPTVQIRRHRLRNIDLATLVKLDTISPLLAAFLTAAVRSGRSIVVAGAQGAGKTTLVRALCAAFGSWEKIGTFETERELGLDKLDKHARVIAWEARPGSGEISADGRRAGEVTLRDLLKSSFRYNLDRYVVGEVRGDEILEMIEAMISGQGTISTTHARNARDILSKLVTCALKAGPNISETYATKAIAQHVDLMIYIKRDQTPLAPGRRASPAVRDSSPRSSQPAGARTDPTTPTSSSPALTATPSQTSSRTTCGIWPTTASISMPSIAKVDTDELVPDRRRRGNARPHRHRPGSGRRDRSTPQQGIPYFAPAAEDPATVTLGSPHPPHPGGHR